MHEDPELVREFLIECHENLDQLDRDLVALEAAPRDAAILARIFRTLHTIKGSCAFLGFSKLGGVAHAGEQLLDKLRDGQFQINPTIANALLGTVDAIRTMLGCIESHGHDGAQEYASLVQTLGDLSSGKAPAPPPRATPAKVPSTADVVVRPSQAAIVWPATGPEPAGGSNTVVLAPQAGAPPAGPGTEPDEPSLLGVPAGTTAPPAEVPRPPPRAEPLGQSPAAPPRRRRPPRKPASATPPSEPPPPLPTPSAATAFGQSMFTTEGMAAPAEAAPAQVLDATIRLDVRVIDKLMTLVSELVLARNQVLQYSTSLDSATPGGAGFVGVTRALNLITTELQEQVMKTRMQPIDVVWSRFPRLVRDVARTCAKQVRLDVQGSETELDKTVIEAIRDPLTHLVRNAVDHGIETPELRRAKGKPPEGRLLLRAFHEAGQVNIEVADDGDGIDPARVRNRAVERKLLTPDQALQLSDEAAVALVFLPGFSTATTVTSVSGRGVGMDVVKTNVERVGGSFDVHSTVGQGTTVRMRIPLTLAIVKALVVGCAGERYAVPQVSIVELLRLEHDAAQRAIELLHDAPVLRFRGRLLPILYFDRVLHIENRPAAAVAADAVNIAILQAGDRQFGLVVDRVDDAQEIVVKPLWQKLKGIACFAGATIMGDGHVALILDVFGLARQTGMAAKGRDALAAAPTAIAVAPAQPHGILLVEGAEHQRLAIPLEYVDRLEEFPAQAIERMGAQHVVQYRGAILPLLDLCGRFQARGEKAAAGELVRVVVHARAGMRVGLVVARIVDVIEHEVPVEPGRERGRCSSVVQGRITEFLDVPRLLSGTGIPA